MVLYIIAEAQGLDWNAIIIQLIIALVAVFTGTGFWELKKAKFEAKREDKKADKNYDGKLDKISAQVSELSTQVTSVSGKVDFVTDDVQEMKQDLILLQEANEATVKYREMRDSMDKDAIEVQGAIIESIKGLMRDRLLDNYKRCVKKGYYSMEEREIYGKMFECYEKPPFNGNGVMHDLQPIMKALPIHPEDEYEDDLG